ncbi:nucleoside hydrolase [Coraliomargarita sp. W4R53]
MEPVYIFDTDMGNDVDDLMAQILLIRGMAEGGGTLGAAVVNKGNRLAPAFVDLVNRFYGWPEVPIGWCPDGPTPAEAAAGENGFLRPVLERVGPEWLDYEPDCKDWPDAVAVLRQALASAEDHSVVYISIGFTTIIRQLLASSADQFSSLSGLELVKSKVRFVSMMGGEFDHLCNGQKPHLEHNIAGDIESARSVISMLPCPIIFSGFELGEHFEFPGYKIEEAFAENLNHPLPFSYDLYQGFEHNRPLWDLTSVLFALAPDAGYFDVSVSGHVTVGSDGATHFVPDENGTHRYLKFRAESMVAVMQIFVESCLYPEASIVLRKSPISYV